MNKKLYAVKTDEGKYLDMDPAPWWDDKAGIAVKTSALARMWAKNHGGHVVALIEEPEKLVLTKEQAEIVEDAHDEEFPATYISDSSDEAGSDEEELLMKAYVNGYTVAKEKEYVAYKVLGGKQNKDSHTEYAQACREFYHPETMFWVLTNGIIDDPGAKFTEKEIADYGLQDCQKVVCADSARTTGEVKD